MRRLSDSQFYCLWAISCGSYGHGSNKRTLRSLSQRDLIYSMRNQGELRWWTTDLGETVVSEDERSQP